jgi:hypothetical protein
MNLPRDSQYFLDKLAELQQRIRAHLWKLVCSTTAEELSAVAASREGDTIFTLDEHAEEVVEEFFSAWGEELPLLLVMEGFPGDGGKTYPEGTPRNEVDFTCIVDPIDGTRSLMYGKRSAWVLSAIALAKRHSLPSLADIQIAMQTELPTPRSHLSDVLWAVRGQTLGAETLDLETGAIRSFRPQPSRANSLLYGFGTVTKFFPGTKLLAAEIEEHLAQEIFGPPLDGNPQIFDDEYICSGGQLYELAVGHDRFIADLRPLLLAAGGQERAIHRLCAHPYDLCTELIAREAGVLVTDAWGKPLRYSFDIRTDCSWIGYANDAIRDQVEPVLQRALREVDRSEETQWGHRDPPDGGS